MRNRFGLRATDNHRAGLFRSVAERAEKRALARESDGPGSESWLHVPRPAACLLLHKMGQCLCLALLACSYKLKGQVRQESLMVKVTGFGSDRPGFSCCCLSHF